MRYKISKMGITTKMMIGLLFVLLLSEIQSKSIYKLVKHQNDTNARCLDGSPSALYISEGDTDNILVYFQGGGMCSGLTLQATIEDCWNRSQTNYGSSKEYPPERDYQDFTILSNSQETNPLYASWTKVFIPYCDGGLHTGSKQATVSYKGIDLHFRGANNTIAHLNYLQDKYSFFQAKKIVLTGTSAGAIAAIAWGNYISDKADNKDDILIISDSGLFVSNFYNPLTNSTRPNEDIYISQLIYTETPPPYTQCLQKYGDKCGTVQVVECLKAPVFFIQSEYDLFGIVMILNLQCTQQMFPASLKNCNQTEMFLIEKYRQDTIDLVNKVIQNGKNGVWAVSCAQHGFFMKNDYYYSKNYLVPGNNGKSILEALVGFVMRDGQDVIIDNAKWPQNVGCNGMQGRMNLMSE